jgi:hypothetical protein
MTYEGKGVDTIKMVSTPFPFNSMSHIIHISILFSVKMSITIREGLYLCHVKRYRYIIKMIEWTTNTSSILNTQRRISGMKKILIALILFGGIVAGCSNEKENTQQNEDKPSLEFVEVSIQTPEQINLNEEIHIQAVVTQGTDLVDDANEVKFELWKVGQEEHEKIEAQNDGKGVYSIKKTFSDNGQYAVIAHVTARSMHSMPKKEFTVGTPEEEVTHEEHESEDDAATGHDDSQHGDDHGHHDSSIVFDFNQDQAFTVNKEVILKTSLTYENAPLSGAKVRYEIIPSDDSKIWLDANENGEATYVAPITFKNAGTYHIQIHVNKDEIHEHKVIMIDVK